MNDRAALVIGISDYESSDVFGRLPGATNDARAISEILRENDDENRNFEVELVNSETGGTLTKHLKSMINQHLEAPLRAIVIYYSGHGFLDKEGDLAYLVAADGDTDRPGVEMSWILNQVNRTQEQNATRSVVIILDCCHAGAMGSDNGLGAGIPSTTIDRGVTILAACEAKQQAVESGGIGRFTGLLVDGLKGGAADIGGYITPAALYTHIDQSLGAIEQRPVFATNVNRTVSLRKSMPKVAAAVLRELPSLFSEPDDAIDLDPSWEGNRGEDFELVLEDDPQKRILKDYPVDAANAENFQKLQALTRQGLVQPIGEDHMFFAAIRFKRCGLTELGKHYWRLAKAGRLP